MKRTHVFLVSLLLSGILIAQGSSYQAVGGIGSQSVNKELQAFLNSNEYFPVPGDIFTLTLVILGPGAQSVLGNSGNNIYNLVLRKDYSLYVPVAGTLSVKGMNYDQIRDRVIESVSRKLAVDFIDFQFSLPVSFQVFVDGLVKRPGLINATSIMRVSDIIQASGGYGAGATNRRISLKRSDGGERTVDIWSYSRNGDQDTNPLLLPGDRINVGESVKSVRIDGAVLTPGVYELTDSDRIPDLIGYANGLSAKASKQAFRIVRGNADGTYSTLFADFASPGNFALLDGDAILVPAVEENAAYVTVEGAFFGKANAGAESVSIPTSALSAPATSVDSVSLQSLSVPSPIKVFLAHYAGMNLYDIMERLGGPTRYAYGSLGTIYGAKGGEPRNFDALELWAKPEECRKIIIYPGDFVLVPMKNQIVTMSGEVNIPRVLPFMEKRTVREYLALAGGVAQSGLKGFFICCDSIGENKKKVGLDYIPEPEDVIIVRQNGWKAFFNWWGKPGPITTTTTVLAFATTILTFIIRIFDVRALFK